MFSIAFQSDKPLGDYGPLAARVEELGFEGVSLYNDLWYQPPWLPLAEMARQTRRVRLGPAAVNPFTCHPVNIAGQVALLEELSQGRAYLGLARGAWLDQIGIRPANPIEALEEAFRAIRYLLNPEGAPPAQASFPLPAHARLRWPLPSRRVPFLLGSRGTQTIRRCLEHVDVVKLGGTSNPEVVEEKKRLLAGRARLVAGCVCVVDRDGEAARQRARREALLYLPVVARFDPYLRRCSAQVTRIKSLVSQGREEEALAEISDDMLDRCALAGDPSAVIESSRRLLEAGVERLEFGTPHGLSTREGLHLLGTEVLPALRASGH